ncbi:triphosphoribosyl-dephospho-CoA synthase [Alcaligenes sp. CHO6]|uniref:triphosphoribosyl-dephospho-CoA synthase n=1 Tax=Alcaligenes sp. CHO6 TaxID=3123298 RepID=UPI00301525CA
MLLDAIETRVWAPPPTPPERMDPSPSWRCADIGRAAVLALYDELILAPKPGLVSLLDSGSHDDMDASTFYRSLFALRHYFSDMAALGQQRAPFCQLQTRGMAAEARMQAATAGINTHRGAIFMLGLLCAAAGACLPFRALTPATIRDQLQTLWGAALQARSQQTSSALPGGQAVRRYGLQGANQEAAQGFPTLFETAWPAWQAAVNLLSPHSAPITDQQLQTVGLHTFFSVMAVLDDSNLAHRGGLEGLHYARRCAAQYLHAGSAFTPDAVQRAQTLHHAFMQRRLSPGGAADTLSACYWLDRLQATAPGRARQRRPIGV